MRQHNILEGMCEAVWLGCIQRIGPLDSVWSKSKVAEDLDTSKPLSFRDSSSFIPFDPKS